MDNDLIELVKQQNDIIDTYKNIMIPNLKSQIEKYEEIEENLKKLIANLKIEISINERLDDLRKEILVSNIGRPITNEMIHKLYSIDE